MILHNWISFLILCIGVVISDRIPQTQDCFLTWYDINPQYCQEQDAIPMQNKEFCRWFCQCINGTYQPMECYLGRYYNPVKEQCLHDDTYCRVQPFPICGESNADEVRVDTNSRYYFVCVNGSWVKNDCGPWYVYHPKTKHCDYWWNP